MNASEYADDASATPSLWRRMACWVYEGLLLFGLVFFAGLVFAVLTQSRHALDSRFALQLFLFVVLGLYFNWFWRKGQTLAMQTWGIRVVDRHAAPLTRLRALWRYVLAWLWFWPPLALLALLPRWYDSPALAASVLGLWVVFWALLSLLMPRRQFVHDVWAGTQLLRHRPPGGALARRKWWQA